MACCRVATTLRGFIGYGVFLGSWVGAIFFMPTLGFMLVWSRFSAPYTYLLAALLVYYAVRAVVPARSWPWLHSKLARQTHSDNGRYFRHQQLVTQAPLPAPNSKELFGFHPHGVLCCGWAINGCMGPTLVPSQINWLGTGSLFLLPVIRDMLTWYNGKSAEKGSFVQLMKEGRNLAVIPGGFEEATIFKHGRHRVYLRNRKGFIKYALQHGYTLRPVYTFGEEMTYWTLPGLERIGLWLNKFKVPGAVAMGKYMFMPNDDVDLTTVIGTPLKLPTIAKPSREQVNEWHTKYMAALQHLFDTHKAKYAAQGARAELSIE